MKPIPTCLESHPSKACSEFMSYSLYELNCLAPASAIEYEVDKGRPNFWAWWTHAARSAIFLPQYLKRACARFLRGGAFSDHVPLSIMPFYNVRRDRQAVLRVASQGKYSWSAFCNNFWSGLRRDLRRRENVQCCIAAWAFSSSLLVYLRLTTAPIRLLCGQSRRTIPPADFWQPYDSLRCA